MAHLPAKSILGLPVETQSGVRLGVIKNFEVDTEQHVVVQYYVAPRIPKPFQPEVLMIAAAQVLAIEQKRMVVVDAVLRDGVLIPVTGV